MANKETELRQLRSIRKCYLEIDRLEEQIQAEQERVKKIKKSVKRHDFKPPKSKVSEVRINLLGPLYRRVDKMAKVLFIIYLIVGIGMILLSGYSVFQASATMTSDNLFLFSIGREVLRILKTLSGLVFAPAFEIPFIVALILFGKFIKKDSYYNDFFPKNFETKAVNSSIEGTVKQLLYKWGDAVEVGDCLLVLENKAGKEIKFYAEYDGEFQPALLYEGKTISKNDCLFRIVFVK